MKQISVQEKKLILLEILDEIHNFCKENNITYFINCGTLLGAIRHKGFIPWDDDIDISMLRKDYEKFKILYNQKGFSLINFEQNNYFPLPFLKVSSDKTYGTINNIIPLNYGVAVDIFPVDDYPNQESLRKKFFRSVDMLNNKYIIALSCNYIRKHSFLKDLIKKIISIFLSAHKLCKKIDEVSKKYNSDDAIYAGCLVAIVNHKMEIALKDSYKEQIMLPFEGRNYFAPIGFDNILRSLYGDDYMIPPAENDRHTTHAEQYYWKEQNNV